MKKIYIFLGICCIVLSACGKEKQEIDVNTETMIQENSEIVTETKDSEEIIPEEKILHSDILGVEYDRFVISIDYPKLFGDELWKTPVSSSNILYVRNAMETLEELYATKEESRTSLHPEEMENKLLNSEKVTISDEVLEQIKETEDYYRMENDGEKLEVNKPYPLTYGVSIYNYALIKGGDEGRFVQGNLIVAVIRSSSGIRYAKMLEKDYNTNWAKYSSKIDLIKEIFGLEGWMMYQVDETTTVVEFLEDGSSITYEVD